MRQYTQGPYETENDAPYIYATDEVIAKIFTNGVFLTDKERATRDLLAAAPELLDVLKKLLKLPEAVKQLEYLEKGIGVKSSSNVWLEARKIITKVEGS